MKKLPRGLLFLGLSFLALGCERGPLGELWPPGRPGPTTPPPRPVPPPDAGTPDAPPPPPACTSTADVNRDIFQPKCNVCHSSSPGSDYPDLVSPGVRQRLIDGRSRHCQDKPFVTIAADGEVGGHLFDKFAGAGPGCGMQMPFGAFAPLSDAEVACVRRWLSPSWQEPPAP